MGRAEKRRFGNKMAVIAEANLDSQNVDAEALSNII